MDLNSAGIIWLAIHLWIFPFMRSWSNIDLLEICVRLAPQSIGCSTDQCTLAAEHPLSKCNDSENDSSIHLNCGDGGVHSIQLFSISLLADRKSRSVYGQPQSPDSTSRRRCDLSLCEKSMRQYSSLYTLAPSNLVGYGMMESCVLVSIILHKGLTFPQYVKSCKKC